MKKRNLLFFAFMFLIFVIVCNNKCYAGEQRLNSIDYQVELNKDGSANVTETWDITVSSTNTLFKDFDIDSSKYGSITNVQVKDLNKNKQYEQIEEEMYHVTPGCFYALPIKNGTKFEIAWNAGFDNSKGDAKYSISYKILDCIKQYNDCDEFYWQFIGKDNGIPAEEVKGTIKLPNGVENIEKLRVWAHGPLDGDIQKSSNSEVVFSVPYLSTETMVETRIVTEENIFSEATKINKNKLDEILQEEQQWADEANRIRKRNEIIGNIIVAVLVIIFIIVTVFLLLKTIKYIKQLRQMPKRKKQDLKYFRDIPREKTSTPGEAMFLYYTKNNNYYYSSKISNLISATILQLALKKCINFSKDNNDEKNVKITFSCDKQKAKQDLAKDEYLVFEMLHNSAKGLEYTTMKMLNDYAKENYDSIKNKIDDIDDVIENSHIQVGNYIKDSKNTANTYHGKSIGYFVASLFVIYFAPTIVIQLIINGILCRIIYNKFKTLTEQGETEQAQWKGLKNYMNDYSLLKEKEVPDLVLWEKYLVYATAFGISEKVIKELKLQYEELNMQNNDDLTYLPFIMSNDNFNNKLNSGVTHFYNTYNSSYSSAHYSSGSGGGGGFSGGGGRRRRRRPEWAEDNFVYKNVLIK